MSNDHLSFVLSISWIKPSYIHCTTRYNICQWLATGGWISQSTPDSSTRYKFCQ